jgi:hypothetical protein
VIPVRAVGTLDQPAKAKPSEVVGHLGGGIGTTEERSDARAKVVMTEAGRETGEAGKRLTQGLDARIGEPQRGESECARREADVVTDPMRRALMCSDG